MASLTCPTFVLLPRIAIGNDRFEANVILRSDGDDDAYSH